MKRKANTGSGVYNYLQSSGVLDTGDAAEIANKRKEYWRDVKKKWKQQKKQTSAEFVLYFNDAELLEISKAAQAHGISKTRYCRNAVLAYTHTRYLVPSAAAINHLVQLLSLNYAALQDIAKDQFQTSSSTVLLEKMSQLELQVRSALIHPRSLEQAIVDALRERPEYRLTILQLLQNL